MDGQQKLDKKTAKLIEKLLHNLGFSQSGNPAVIITPEDLTLSINNKERLLHCEKVNLQGVKLKHTLHARDLGIDDQKAFEEQLQHTAAIKAKEVIQSLWKEASQRQSKKQQLLEGTLSTNAPRAINITGEPAATLLTDTGELNYKELKQTFYEVLNDQIKSMGWRTGAYKNAFQVATVIEALADEKVVERDVSINPAMEGAPHLEDYLPLGTYKTVRTRVLLNEKPPQVQLFNFFPEHQVEVEESGNPNAGAIKEQGVACFLHEEYEHALKHAHLHAPIALEKRGWEPPLFTAIPKQFANENCYYSEWQHLPTKCSEINNPYLTFTPPSNPKQFLGELCKNLNVVLKRGEANKNKGDEWLEWEPGAESYLESLPSAHVDPADTAHDHTSENPTTEHRALVQKDKSHAQRIILEDFLGGSWSRSPTSKGR